MPANVRPRASGRAREAVVLPDSDGRQPDYSFVPQYFRGTIRAGQVWCGGHRVGAANIMGVGNVVVGDESVFSVSV